MRRWRRRRRQRGVMAVYIPHASSRHGCLQSLAAKRKPKGPWLRHGGSGPLSALTKSGASSASRLRGTWSRFGLNPTNRPTLQIKFEDCLLDTDRRELRRGNALVAVEPQVFDVLIYLVEHRERVVSKDDLIASLWAGRIVSESTLTSRINAVRQAIGGTGEKQNLIRTFARKGFRFVAPVEVRNEEPTATPGKQDGLALAVPQKPSIAVLPFANMSSDSEQDSFVDGVTEEIITALSRVRWFFVIARGSTFAYRSSDISPEEIARELGVRYILMGSVRRAGERIRVTAQLIDGNSRSNVWARTYDRDLSDIFSVQDEITQTIVGGIEPELSRAERERARIKQRDSVDAWSIYQRGMFHLYRYTKDDLAQARKLFEEAIALDPELGPAYSAIAETYYYEVVYGFIPPRDDTREHALESAQKAVALDREDAGAHCTLGRMRYLGRDYAAAILELETCTGPQSESGARTLRSRRGFRILRKTASCLSASGVGDPAQSSRSEHGVISRTHCRSEISHRRR